MNIHERATAILGVQRDAVQELQVTPGLERAIAKVAEYFSGSGRVITTGMGKAGIIATKMSATLASIGCPSFFVHPAEAAHGDVGRIAPEDLVVVFSNSGRTGEVVNMIRALHALNAHANFVVYIGSTDAPRIEADLVVSYGDVRESCLVEKVPSTSTTLMLVIADLIAITAAELQGLDTGWFKARHPGGAIGESFRAKKE